MCLSRLIVCGVALFIGVMIWYAIVQAPEPELAPVHSLRSWQEADAPPGYPAKKLGHQPAQFDHRLGLLTPMERYLVPLAPRFDYPLGAENGAFSYNAQPYWSLNKKRGGRHTGDDFNGIGGMNSDLGDPVYAIGNGRVVYAGTPAKGWGKVLILMHRLPDGRYVESFYAHLHKILKPIGALIARGEKIGEVGGANGLYLAHLHFELRESDGVEIGRGYSLLTKNRLNPSAHLRASRKNRDKELAPSLLAHRKKIDRASTQQLPSMDAESATRFADFMSREKK